MGFILTYLLGMDETIFNWKFFRNNTDNKTIISTSLEDIKIEGNDFNDIKIKGDKIIKLWDKNSDKLLLSLKGHEKPVISANFSPNGKIIASASADKTVKLWDSNSGKLLHTLKIHKITPSTVVFSPDSKIIVPIPFLSFRIPFFFGQESIEFWDSNTGKLLYTLGKDKNSFVRINFSPDSKTIALHSFSASKDEMSTETTVLRDTRNGKLICTLKVNKSKSPEMSGVIFSPNSRIIASSSQQDGNVKLWDSKNCKLLRTLKIESIPKASGEFLLGKNLIFSPDGKKIASASKKTVKIWDSKTGNLLYNLGGVEEHKDLIFRLVFSPDGKKIASVAKDETVKIWDSETSKLINTITGHKSQLGIVSFSPDSKTIASISENNTVKLWNIESGKLLDTFKHQAKALVNVVVFSPDGKTIASASNDGTVKIWNWDFDDFDSLTTRACNKLKSYLLNNIDKLEELKVCQNTEILTKAAFTLVKQGEELAKDGDYEAAVEKFRKAKEWNPKLNINPEEKAKGKK